MYDLPHHKALDEQDTKDLIARYPFAFFTGCDAQNRPVATQIPVFIEEHEGRRILRGHIMKHTDHHKAFLHNPNVLVVFTGHHSYVSGTWYSNPHTPSTWNYMSVHIRGVVRFLDDAALVDALRTITLHFEHNDPRSTTVYDNIPPEFLQRVMGAIVAFEVEVQEIKTVFKLSQDRDQESYRNIMAKLKEQGESGQVIAAEMAKREKSVFPQA
ncbi:MAG: FMN-binding negative transcriptional regulator [Flavobacteriales bacterium]